MQLEEKEDNDSIFISNEPKILPVKINNYVVAAIDQINKKFSI